MIFTTHTKVNSSPTGIGSIAPIAYAQCIARVCTFGGMAAIFRFLTILAVCAVCASASTSTTSSSSSPSTDTIVSLSQWLTPSVQFFTGPIPSSSSSSDGDDDDGANAIEISGTVLMVGVIICVVVFFVVVLWRFCLKKSDRTHTYSNMQDL